MAYTGKAAPDLDTKQYRKDKNMPKSKYAHFTLESRTLLFRLLNENRSFRSIASIIGCSVSSITNEILKHRIYRDLSWKDSSRDCRSTRLVKAPYVCNGCENFKGCRRSKYLYDPAKAHEEYMKTLKESRSGIRSSAEGIAYIDELITPLIKEKGQTVDHILLSNELGISRSTLYRYIDDGLLSIRNIDLKRRVRYSNKRSKSSKQENRTERASLRSRKYLDFLAYTKANPKASITEMDTVIGKRDESFAILTLILRKSNFMMGFFLEHKSSSEVVKTFDLIEKTIGKKTFRKIFEVVLTDNGSEFAATERMEDLKDEDRRCRIFYCDPRASQQKGKCEKNHEYIRYYIPKGSSFGFLDQDKVTQMFSNINSIRRKELDGKCPFELLSATELKAMKKLGYVFIPPKDVEITSKLFSKNS